ncbi:MAG: DUF2798 domain-containing protein [Candidatus Gracilibacteria bacterium]|nr:DUF2798 domain-containing protein [Candidatus Gracilibacteria bacterium]
MNFKKLKKFLPIILFIALVALSLTFILTYINIGFGNGFLIGWFKSFIITFCVISPLGISSTFILSKLVNFIFPKTKEITKKIILAILMGFVIEFFVSFINVCSTFGFVYNFLNIWLRLYINSIPVGICLGFFMSFVFKPWMGKRIKSIKEID